MLFCFLSSTLTLVPRALRGLCNLTAAQPWRAAPTVASGGRRYRVDLRELCADGRTITTVKDMQEAARDLADLGPQAVLVKGGHLGNGPGTPGVEATADGDPPAAAAALVDVLYSRATEDIRDLATPRVDTENTHGTGCTLAAAVAAHLARGESVHAAVEAAQRYVHECIARSVPLCVGSGAQGAMDHGGGLVEIGGGEGREVAAARAARAVQREVDYAVYAVTDDDMNARQGRSMEEAVREAVAGGATVIQIRCVLRSRAVLPDACFVCQRGDLTWGTSGGVTWISSVCVVPCELCRRGRAGVMS